MKLIHTWVHRFPLSGRRFDGGRESALFCNRGETVFSIYGTERNVCSTFIFQLERPCKWFRFTSFVKMKINSFFPTRNWRFDHWRRNLKKHHLCVFQKNAQSSFHPSKSTIFTTILGRNSRKLFIDAFFRFLKGAPSKQTRSILRKN